MSNIQNTDGRPTQLTAADPRYVDYYGRPWAKNWEKYFEAGWDKFCDKILYVDAPRDIRLERAVARGWSTEQFAAREASQMPLVDKAVRSHIVIRNAKTLEHIRDVLRLTWRHRFVGDQTEGD